jgi:hypothetical protein
MLVVFALAVGALAAQDQLPAFSSSVQLVEVYATVNDEKGELVTGLRQSDFTVLEDGVPQEVTTFAAGEFPLTVALGVDRSFSMAGEPLTLAKQASQAFLRELRPADRSMVVAIGNEAEVIAPLSADRTAQSRAIASLDAWSTTALYDAIVATLDRLEPEAGRQAIVVFSDGADRYSEHKAADVLDRARRSNALIYPIAIGKARPADRWTILPVARRPRARTDARHGCARAAIPVPDWLHAVQGAAARRARMEIDQGEREGVPPRSPSAGPGRLYDRVESVHAPTHPRSLRRSLFSGCGGARPARPRYFARARVCCRAVAR